MRKLIYHVAMTLDHYIAHEDGSIGGFSKFSEGEHVTDYLEQLNSYDTVVMGKNTYTFGYQFGLKPGQPAYPHMKHYIFSKSLQFETEPDERVKVVNQNELGCIRELKEEEGTDIYLCGGGSFAGFLLEHELIDELRIKLYPFLFGRGIKLFGNSPKAVELELLDTKVYNTGAQLLTYQIKYS